MLKTTKLIGTQLLSKADFKDFADKPIVPTNAKFKYKTPSAIVTSLNVTPINNVFSATVLLNESGTWLFRWECEGAYASADEFEIYVEPSAI